MLPLLDEDEDRAIATAQESLAASPSGTPRPGPTDMRAKLGLPDGLSADVLRPLLEDSEGLMTGKPGGPHLVLPRPGPRPSGDAEPARGAGLDLPAFDAWTERWLALGPDAHAMRRGQPVYVPRNHLVEEALTAATEGDLAPTERLLDVVRRPYEERPGDERYAAPAPPELG